MDTNTNLNELKNIHLPDPVSIFPLAIGWYILIILTLIIAGVYFWWKFKYIKRQKYIRNIYHMLAILYKGNANNNETIAEVSILIKRVAMMKFPEQQPHKLFGEQWLIFLDTTGKTNNFTNGAGRNLLNIYNNQSIDNPEEFFNVIKQWLGVIL